MPRTLMTFINEFTPPEDVEKYGLKQIDKKYEWIGARMGSNSSANCIYFIGRIWS